MEQATDPIVSVDDGDAERSGKISAKDCSNEGWFCLSVEPAVLKKTIDDLIGDLEEALFTADIGVRTSQRLVDSVHEKLNAGQLTDSDQVWSPEESEIETFSISRHSHRYRLKNPT